MPEPTVELVWVARGPLLDAARLAMAPALRHAGLLPVWDEWKADDPLRPRALKSDPAGPRLYVNGHRAWTTPEGWLGERTIASIAAAILTARSRPPRSRPHDPLSRRLKYILLPSAGLALLPKCPLCWMAYASITTAFGLAPLAAQRVVFVALSLMLVLGATAIIWRSIRQGVRGPLWPMGAGTALVLAGSNVSEGSPIAFAGLSMMFAAAIWSAWPGTTGTRGTTGT